MRLLIVSYYFPPAGGGGVQRILKFAKFLPQFGIEVHVLTPDDPRWIERDERIEIPAGTSVHRARYIGLTPGKPRQLLHGREGLDRLLTRAKLQPRRLLVPDVVGTWSLTAIPCGRRVIREHGIDVVMSTSPPATDHIVGRAISRATGVPWVAELRDSWLEDQRLRLDRPSVRLKRRINERLSSATVGAADYVVTAADAISREMVTRYPHLDGRVRTIANGVDFDDFDDLPDRSEPGKFLICHTGGFFGRRNPRPFLEALAQLLERRPELRETLRVRFVGKARATDEQYISEHPTLREVVEVVGFVTHLESLAHQKAADALLLLIPKGPNVQGVPSGKLFEYLAAQRPILALVPPEGAAARMIHDANAGVVCDPEDIELIGNAVESMFDDWKQAGTDVVPLSDGLRAQLSRRSKAEELAEVLERVNLGHVRRNSRSR